MITLFYASFLGLLFFKISLETIKGRLKYKVSVGDGPNQEISHLVAAHSNFSAYVPLFLFLLALVEQLGPFPLWTIHLMGLIFSVGRTLHFLAFRDKMNFKLRKLGMKMTLYPLVVLSASGILVYFRSLI